MSTDTQNEWERYIMWSARRHLDAYKSNLDNPSLLKWCKNGMRHILAFEEITKAMALL